MAKLTDEFKAMVVDVLPVDKITIDGNAWILVTGIRVEVSGSDLTLTTMQNDKTLGTYASNEFYTEVTLNLDKDKEYSNDIDCVVIKRLGFFGRFFKGKKPRQPDSFTVKFYKEGRLLKTVYPPLTDPGTAHIPLDGYDLRIKFIWT